VTLASPTKGAEIRYTTDGSEPTAASKLYAEPIPVAGDGKSRTIKAFAVAPGYSASAGASAVYAIKYVPTATPAFSPASGSYATEQSVSIACPTEGAVIYYSLSTSGAPADPTADSPVYSKPIAVGAGVTTTIKAMALQPGGGLGYSAIASALYNHQLEMVGVPGGSYTSSSQTVTVSSFSMSKYEITKKLYQAITGSSPSYFIEDDSRPVEQVTWYDAVEFCNLLSLREGRAPVYAISDRVPPAGYPITGASVTADWSKNGYRLPTEAEWEYAARGGKASRRLTYAGSNDPDAVGWSKGNSGNATHPVGAKAPNELGLYDLSGNVWEWCWDRYGPYPSGPRSDPLGASAGTNRVQRGGSWYDIDKFGTVSSRGYYDPSATVINFGFRVVYRD
jgi:formylglycine-generating enzyme required for sulfatase activity